MNSTATRSLMYITEEANLSEAQLTRIRQAAPWCRVELADREALRTCAANAEILSGIDTAMPTEIFDVPGRLRWVNLFHVGPDEIWVPALIQSDIVVTCSKGPAYSIPMAEHCLAAMLVHEKEFLREWKNQMKGTWDRRPVGELYGKTVCIVGLGNIGCEIARRAAFFGMQVVGVRRSGLPVPQVERVVPPSELRDVLPEADYVVLIVPQTPETVGMFGAEEIAAMKRGACLVNMCRGQVVDQPALIEALQSGHLSGAALDATDPEPLPAESELWYLPNVMITPHNSGKTPGSRDRSVDQFCENLGRYRHGEPLLQVVDKELGY